MEEMTTKLDKETKKLSVAERRRKLELEGYASDLSAMRKKIVFYEKYVGKLKRLVDEDNAELLNAAMDAEEMDEQAETDLADHMLDEEDDEDL